MPATALRPGRPRHAGGPLAGHLRRVRNRIPPPPPPAVGRVPLPAVRQGKGAAVVGRIRVVIEVADGIVRVTADGRVEILLLRYDDLLADAQPEDCPVAVDRRRVERLFRTHGP